jgi:hypothetical protein
MTYILMLYTVVALANHTQASDWRPIGEFHSGGDKTASLLCEEAAGKLGLNSKSYRCVRSK